jgi:aminocarboxymuconate-semialdehyde decarboxylase
MPHSTISMLDFEDKLNRYGPTAARTVSTERIRLPTKTIDAHAHVFIPAAAEYVAPHFSLAKDSFFVQIPEKTKETNLGQNRDRRIALTDSKDRIRILDTQGIDLQVLAPQPPQSYYEIAPEHTRKAARLVNDGIAAVVAEFPTRLAGVGTVPLNDPDAAVIELKRLTLELGFKGVQVLTNVNGIELTHPQLDPFWAAAHELGCVVMIHPYGSTSMGRFGDYYLANSLGNPLDTAIALHHIILSGLLDRYPHLKIFAVHGGGYLPAYSGRLDHAWGARRDAQGAIPRRPSDYLRQIYFDSLVFTPHQLEYLVKVYGADHVLMGTDYPFDMAEYYPIELVTSVESFTDEQRAAVAGGAAAKLFGFAD